MIIACASQIRPKTQNLWDCSRSNGIVIYAPKRIQAIRDSATIYMQAIADLEARVRDPRIRETNSTGSERGWGHRNILPGQLVARIANRGARMHLARKRRMALQVAALKFKALHNTLVKYRPKLTTI